VSEIFARDDLPENERVTTTQRTVLSDASNADRLKRALVFNMRRLRISYVIFRL